MDVDKKEIARQLKEVARLLEVLGEATYRVRAYESAARSVEALKGSVQSLMREDRLHELRGVGKGLAQELSALKEADTLPLLEQLRMKVPKGVQELFAVGGLGAKGIRTLWNSGIADLHTVIEASRDGRLERLPGFGKKRAQTIGVAAEFALSASRRMRLDRALELAESLVGRITRGLPSAQVSVAGSLRRRLETIGDIDLVVSGAALEDVAEVIGPICDEPVTLEPPRIHAQVQRHGVEIGVYDGAAHGGALLYWTGNAAYRHRLVAKSELLGLRLGPDGLKQGSAAVHAPTEQVALDRLGVEHVPPERREWEEPAPANVLVSDQELMGCIHNHTSWSDGVPSIFELADACRGLGYRYLGIADHSQSSQVARGLSREQVLEQAEEVERVRDWLRAEGKHLTLLHGMEVDILADGSLDYDDELLARLDYVVVSVHQNFSLTLLKQTERIVRAVESPYSHILGHPSGRLLLSRPPYEVDLQAVIEACASTGTVIEINANPRRLDLDWRWVIKAKELGCAFSINPDAHTLASLQHVRYGVMMARKAGLQAGDVVNAEPTAEQFLRRLK